MKKASIWTYTFWWYHLSALWIHSKAARRPFTYQMRDFLIEHKAIGILIILAEITGLTFLIRWHWYFWPLLAIYFMTAGHLWWGTKIIEGQQEWPPYVEDEN